MTPSAQPFNPSLKPEHASKLSAKDVTPRKKREFDYVPWNEAQETLNLLKNDLGLTENAILKELGYTASAFHTMRARGTCMRYTLFAMKGLLASHSGDLAKALASQPVEGVSFTDRQTQYLLSLLSNAQKANPGRKEDIVEMRRLLASHLVNLLMKD